VSRLGVNAAKVGFTPPFTPKRRLALTPVGATYIGQTRPDRTSWGERGSVGRRVEHGGATPISMGPARPVRFARWPDRGVAPPCLSHRPVSIRRRGESRVEPTAGRVAVLVGVTGHDRPQGERPRRGVPGGRRVRSLTWSPGSLPLRGQFQEGFKPHVGGAGTREVGPRKSMGAEQLRAVPRPKTCGARGRSPGRTPGHDRGQQLWHPGGPYLVGICRSLYPATPPSHARPGSPDSHARCSGEAAVRPAGCRAHDSRRTRTESHQGGATLHGRGQRLGAVKCCRRGSLPLGRSDQSIEHARLAERASTTSYRCEFAGPGPALTT
jgi:hypothetical protein